MKPIVKRLLLILLILCALISLGLGIYLFVSRPKDFGGLSLTEGPLNMVNLLNREYPTYGDASPDLPAEEDVPEKDPGVLLTGQDFSASILKDGRTGVRLDISDDIDWDISFNANPWEKQYSFTTEWTLHL